MSQSRKMKFGRYDYAAFSCFTGYACCSVVVPVVLIELARSLNFPLTDGGMGAGGALQLGRSIPMVFAMLFCGFAAGRWGKVPTLGVSLLIMAAGIMLASAAPAYGLLFLAVAIAGLGEGVIEGLATPVVQDLHEHEEPGRYINFAHSFWSRWAWSGFRLWGGSSCCWREFSPWYPPCSFCCPAAEHATPTSRKNFIGLRSGATRPR